MPITETTVTNVVCDNPACPGNSLDTHALAGWILVNSEVYGQESKQNVFCSSGCVSAASAAAPADAPPVFAT